MDLFAEMLLRYLRAKHADVTQVTQVRPPMVRRLSRLPVLGRQRLAANADRFLNRFRYYPRHLRGRVCDFDWFHVVDHSYAQLVHHLPAGQVGVFCHDLDTFRCLLQPEVEPRPRWFRAMARQVLRGLQKAAVIFYTTTIVGREIERHGLVDPSLLVQAPPGFSPEFNPEPVEPEPALGLRLEEGPFLLHVGSCIPRKRIDVLLEVFAGVRAECRELRLVQVGGEWTPSQRQQLDRLGITGAVTQLRGLDRTVLASLYRRAALVLLPSEAEGFGLPAIEAMACGALVVASDIPVLREVGGDAVVYCPTADIDVWVQTVRRLLLEPSGVPARSARLTQARRYSWDEHARTILSAYQRLARRALPQLQLA